MRRLVRFLSLLSLLLSAAVLVLWVRSYFVADEWMITRTRMMELLIVEQRLELGTFDGRFTFGYRRAVISEAKLEWLPGLDVVHFRFDILGHYPLSKQVWFDSDRQKDKPFGGTFFAGTETYQRVSVPAWFLVVILATAPVLKAVRAFRRRRLIRQRESRGQCVQCGYDLRGTLQRCPECATFRKRRMWKWVSTPGVSPTGQDANR